MSELTDAQKLMNAAEWLKYYSENSARRENALRDALRAAKRTCEHYCVERRMSSGEWDRCFCGTVEHNSKIDEALKAGLTIP